VVQDVLACSMTSWLKVVNRISHTLE